MQKVVLITGANRGLGFALSKVFMAGGFRVIAHMRNALVENAEPAWKSSTEVVYGDLCSTSTLHDIFLAVGNRLDILINNAGCYQNGRLENLSVSEATRILRTNLLAPIQLAQVLWPALKAAQGAIVNINSLAGLAGGKHEAVYSASKFGLRGFSESLQYEATADGIRVLNVNLGAMNTDMAAGRFEEPDKLIDPAEVADLLFHAIKYQSLRVTNIDVLRRNY